MTAGTSARASPADPSGGARETMPPDDGWWARLPLSTFAARVFERLDAAVIVVDLDGTIRYANPYAELVYGVAPADLIGRRSSDFALEAVTDALRHEIADALRAGASWEGDFAIRRTDGTVLDLHAFNAPVFDGAGTFGGVISLALDPGDTERGGRRSREMFAVARILGEIGGALGPSVDVAPVMEIVTAAARGLTDASAAVYLERTGERPAELAVRASADASGSAASDASLATVVFDDPALAAALAKPGTTRFDDVPGELTDPSVLDRLFPGAAPVRSCLVAPVRSRAGLVVGAVVVGESRSRRFGVDDEQALADVVSHAGVLLDLAEVVRAAEREIAARTRSEQVQRFHAEMGALLSWSFDYPEMFERLARLCVPFLADLCLVDVAGNGVIRRVAAVHADDAKKALVDELGRRYPPDPFGPHPAASVVRGGNAEVAEHMSYEYLRATTRDADHLHIVTELGFTSYMCVPLTARGRTLGALTLVSAGSNRRFGPADLELAEEVARRAGLAIDNARLYAERDYVARALQSSLLPPSLPNIPGVRFTARYRAAGEGSEVGGDFYDVFQSGRNAWWFVVGDVSGKGPRAASIAGLARHTLRAVSMERRSPKGLLAALHATLARGEGQGEFCTVCTALLRPAAGDAPARLIVGSGGHPPPVVRRANGTIELAQCRGPVLGVPVPRPRFLEHTLQLDPGDMVVLYTDGIVEAHHRNQPLFGDERLMSVIGAADDDVDAVADGVLAAVRTYGPDEPRDDLALVVARIGD